MRRLFPVLLLATMLLVLTPAVAYAGPPTQAGPEEGSPDIGEAIGTLGLYAAMMAVLAVGAEVVIDMVRPIFGLQQKMTAEEAFSKLNEWLPGAVEDLGLPKESENRINEAIKGLKATTKEFKGKAEKAQVVVQEQWPEILKGLATQSADKVLTDHWDRIQERLTSTEVGITVDQAGEVKAWLATALNQLSGTSVADMESHLGRLNDVLKSVAEQRNKIQGPARKFWRWLRGRLIKWGEYVATHWGGFGKLVRHLLFVPVYLEYGWARLRGKLEGGSKVIEGIKKLGEIEFDPLKSLKQAAGRILEEDTKQGAEEKKRIKWLRVISAVVGIGLAVSLQVDSLQLLEPVLGGALSAVRCVKEEGCTVECVEEGEEDCTAEWYTFEQMIERSDGHALNDHFNPRLGLPGRFGMAAEWLLVSLTPGIILSGLGAAAGSGYWHDQLERLRGAKQVAGQVQELTMQVKGVAGQGGEEES